MNLKDIKKYSLSRSFDSFNSPQEHADPNVQRERGISLIHEAIDTNSIEERYGELQDMHVDERIQTSRPTITPYTCTYFLFSLGEVVGLIKYMRELLDSNFENAFDTWKIITKYKKHKEYEDDD